MYLYFDKNGVLKTVIPHGEIARQGDTLNLYLCFDQDMFNDESILDYTMDVLFTLPDGTISNNITKIDPNSETNNYYLGLKQFDKLIDSEMTFDLKPGVDYHTFKVSYYAESGIMLSYGKLIAHVRFYKDREFLYEENAVIHIERTLGNQKPKTTITPDEYEELQKLISDYIIKFNSISLIVDVDAIPEDKNAQGRFFYRLKTADGYEYWNKRYDGIWYRFVTNKEIEDVNMLLEELKERIQPLEETIYQFDDRISGLESSLKEEISSRKNEDNALNEDLANEKNKRIENDTLLNNKIGLCESKVNILEQEVNKNFSSVDEKLSQKINKDFSGLGIASSVHSDDTVVVRCAGCDGSNPTTYTLKIGTLMELINSEVDYFKGYHPDLASLKKAHPVGEKGDYAFVGSTDDEQYHMYVWDDRDGGMWEETISGQYTLTSTFDDLQQKLANGDFHIGAIKGNVEGTENTDPLLTSIEINGERYILPSVVLEFLEYPVDGAYTLGAVKINDDIWNISGGSGGGSGNVAIDLNFSENNVEGADELGSIKIKNITWNVLKKSYVDSKIEEIQEYIFANNFNRGEFLSLEKLQEKYPEGSPGEFAFVNTPTDQGDVMLMYVWDEDAHIWKETTSNQYVLSSAFEKFKVNIEEKLKNTGGIIEVEKLPSTSLGVAVPNDGSTVERIYFNKNKTYEEWVQMLESLHYEDKLLSGTFAYFVCGYDDDGAFPGIYILKDVSATPIVYEIAYFLKGEKVIIVFTTQQNTGFPAGTPNYVDYNNICIDTHILLNGQKVGHSNNLISDFISCEPFKETPDKINDKSIYRIKTENSAVPTSGTIQKIYFNTSLTVEEVISYLKNVTFTVTPLLNTPVYPILCADDTLPVIIALYVPSHNFYNILAVTNMSTQESELIFTSDPDARVVGWTRAEYNIDKNVVNNFNGIIIGQENNAISNVVSVSPFKHTKYYNYDGVEYNRVLTEKDKVDSVILDLKLNSLSDEEIKRAFENINFTKEQANSIHENANATIRVHLPSEFAMAILGGCCDFKKVSSFVGMFQGKEMYMFRFHFSAFYDIGIEHFYIYIFGDYETCTASYTHNVAALLRGALSGFDLESLNRHIDNVKQDKLTPGNGIEIDANNVISCTNSGSSGATVATDSAMSDTSTNPVQNKVIKKYVDDKIKEIDIPDEVIVDSAVTQNSSNPVKSSGVYNFVTTETNKIKVTVDSSISASSTNPVQNKIIKSYVDTEVGKAKVTVDSSASDTSTNPVQNKIIKKYVDDGLNKKINTDFAGVSLASNIHKDDVILIKCSGVTYTTTVGVLAQLINTEVDYFKGYYTTLEELQGAHLFGSPGDYAFVGANDKDNDLMVMYIWDEKTKNWEETTSGQYVYINVFDLFQRGVQDGTVHVGAIKGNVDNVPNNTTTLTNIEINGTKYLIPAPVAIDTEIKENSTNPVQNKAIKSYIDGILDNLDIPDGVIVDIEMSDNSTNTVQNKVIKKYVDDKIGEIDIPDAVIVDSAINANSTNPVQNKVVKEYVDSSIEEFSGTFTSELNAKLDIDFSNVDMQATVHDHDLIVLRCEDPEDGGNAYTYKLSVAALAELINTDVNYFKGYYASLEALQTKYPKGEPGDYAFVSDPNRSEYYIMYVWDEAQEEGLWEPTTSTQFVLSSVFETFKQGIENGTMVLPAIAGNVNVAGNENWLRSIKINGTVYQVQNIAVDTVLNDNSTNPVQNKVVKDYIDTEIEDVNGRIDGLDIPDAVIVEEELLANSSNPVQSKAIKSYVDIKVNEAKVTVDGTVSSTSTNPVQNNVIKNYVDTEVNKVKVTVDNSVNDSSTNPVQNKIIKKYVDDKIGQLDIPDGVIVDGSVSDTSTNAIQNKVIKKYVDDEVSEVQGNVDKKINTDFSGLSTLSAVHSDDTIIIRCNGTTYVTTVNTLSQLINTEVDYFKGYHKTLSALQTAHPVGSAGDYAFVGDHKDAEQFVMYIWDDANSNWEETISGQYLLVSAFNEFQQGLQNGTTHVGSIKGNVSNVPNTATTLSNIEINGTQYLIPVAKDITIDSQMSDTSTNPVQNKIVKAYVDKSTGDLALYLEGLIPVVDGDVTETSNNPVASGGVYQFVMGAINSVKLTLDTEVTEDSTNPVTGGGIKTYVDTKVEDAKIAVDSTISGTSTNAVQNKTVKEYVDDQIHILDDTISGKNYVTVADMQEYVAQQFANIANAEDGEY